MRHLWSLLAGVVAAPLAWLLLATGQHRSQATVAGWDRAGFFDTVDLIGPVIFLTVAGLLLGVVGTLRFSPAGPLAAGLLLLLPSIFMLINPPRTLDFFSYGQPRRVFGQDFQPWLPVQNGTLLVLGALLLVAVVSVQRWRRWPQLPAAAPKPIPMATDDEVIAGIGALTEQPDRTPMSDDDILAAAAALDEEKTRSGELTLDQSAVPKTASPPVPAKPAGSAGEADSAGTAAPATPAKPAGASQPDRPAAKAPKKSSKSTKSAKPATQSGAAQQTTKQPAADPDPEQASPDPPGPAAER